VITGPEPTGDEILNGSRGFSPVLSSQDEERRQEWLALWDDDAQHVAATGEHLGTLMWSDDGAVGIRGWYY
jgi:hypothetical protein